MTVQDRAEMKNWHKKKSAWPGKLLKYGLLALIPIVILGLMFLVAKR